MLRTDFDYLSKERVLIVEGSVASEFQRRANYGAPFMPKDLLENAKLIGDIHRGFAEAGANLAVTCTAEASRLLLSGGTTRERLADLHHRAVQICRESVPPNHLVFGGLGSTGALLKPYGNLEESDYREIYREQAKYLTESGVDGFLLEGFSSLIEIEQCLIALREVHSLPIIATMTIIEDGRTKFGDTLEDCFNSLIEKGSDVVGIHGSLGPLEMEAFLVPLKARFPLCLRPNAGYPVKIGSSMTFLSSPEYVAECAELFLAQGAVIVGGAAGFTTDHIKAVANRLHGKRPIHRSTQGKLESESLDIREGQTPMAAPEGPSLSQKIGQRPILTIELEPPRGIEVKPMLDFLNRMKPYGLDGVNIPENPLARAQISAIALARLIRDYTGLESIAHLTCRDRNLISLQAELLGAHVLGVHSILALTGDPSGIGDYPTATSIFDVNSSGLVEIMSRMNLGKDFGMNDLGGATSFRVGIAANPLNESLDEELAVVEAKLKRGASFIQTQPIFDPAAIEPFLRAVEPFKVPVIFGVMLIRDYRHAKFLANEYPGVRIKGSDLERFRLEKPENQGRLSLAFAADLAHQLRSLSGGVYLMSSVGDSSRLLDLLVTLHERAAL